MKGRLNVALRRQREGRRAEYLHGGRIERAKFKPAIDGSGKLVVDICKTLAVAWKTN